MHILLCGFGDVLKLNYKLDIKKESTWHICLTNSVNRKMPFYVEEYGHFDAGSGYYTERQGQENYLLLYTLSGAGKLKYDNQEYLLEPHCAVVIDCTKYHYYSPKDELRWNFKWLHFNGIAAENYYELLFESGYKPIQIKNPKSFESKIDRVFGISEINNIKSIVLASSIMSEIISDIFDNKFSDKNIERFVNHNREITKVIQYIEENYNQDISLCELTKTACLSKYHFSRIFKAHIGTSPYDYLINFRINKSKQLLAKTDLSIGQISGSVGFTDYNNYIRTFTKVVGISPLKYRKNRNSI